MIIVPPAHSTAFAQRRQIILGTIASACGASLPGRVLAQAQGVDVTSRGADPTGSKDSTQAFRDALKDSKSIYVPAGTFIVGGLQLPSGATITGAGEGSILKQPPRQRFVLVSASDNGAPNFTQIRLRNFQLRGTCDTDGFAEQIHLLCLSGVSDALIENVVFRGFRGDGLYIGGGILPNQERHNERITVRHCLFDGINHQNRNGVSIIDGSDVTIQDCRFVNTTSDHMPGAIDIEPNAHDYTVVRRIKIANNTFASIGGDAGVIGVYIPVSLRQQATGFVVEGNIIESANNKAVFAFVQPAGGRPGGQPQVIIRNNTVNKSIGRSIWLLGVTGVRIADNHFSDIGKAALIGGDKPREFVRDVNLLNNTFDRCGSQDSSGLEVHTVDGLHMEHNQWTDCGDGSPDASIVRFAQGTATHVSFAANTFASPGRKAVFAVKASPGFRFEGKNISTPDNQRHDGLTLLMPAEAGMK